MLPSFAFQQHAGAVEATGLAADLGGGEQLLHDALPRRPRSPAGLGCCRLGRPQRVSWGGGGETRVACDCQTHGAIALMSN